MKQVIEDKVRSDQTKAVESMTVKSHKLAYQKLERDIDRAITILLSARDGKMTDKGYYGAAALRTPSYFGLTLSYQHVAQLFNMLNVFQLLPKPSDIKKMNNKYL